MKKFLALLMAAVMTLCLLAACSSGKDDGANDKDPAASDSVSGSDAGNDNKDSDSEDGETSGEFTTITEGKLTMSTNAAFPPYEMTTDADGFEGIDVEIAEAIADKLGLELVIDDMGFTAALQAVQDGKSDIVMAGVTVDDERLLVMDFTNTYATGIQVVIVKEGSDVTLDNLGEKKIGTQNGTTGWKYCTDDYGEDHVTAYDNGLTAVQALVNGQVDCVVIDSAPAQSFVAANPGLVILDTEYTNEDYAIGVGKGNTALLNAINGALNDLIEDGTVQDIIDKYIPADAE